MKQRAIVAASAVAVVGVIGLSSVKSSGQQAPPRPALLQVITVNVKPDMIDAFLDMQAKQTVPALKKGGMPQRDLYQAVYGPLGRFYSVTPIASFGERGAPSPIAKALGAEGEKAYNAAARKLIVSQEYAVIEIIADASYDPTPTAIFPVAVVSFNHVAPGHGPDYLNYLRNDLLPIQKRGQVKRFTVTHGVFGGDPNQYGTVTWVEKLSDLDAGPAVIRVLGAEAASKLTQKTAGIVTGIERLVLVRMEAQSYRARPNS